MGESGWPRRPPRPAERTFRSPDRRFGLRISESELHRMAFACSQSAPCETGGILLGFYNDALDCAVVTTAGIGPDDSQGGSTWFQRGTRGLQAWLDHLWTTRKGYYLGEWHSHPFGLAEPSLTDLRQMRQLAASDELHCPEPILLLSGGDPSTGWQIRAFVILHDGSTIELPCTSSL